MVGCRPWQPGARVLWLCALFWTAVQSWVTSPVDQESRKIAWSSPGSGLEDEGLGGGLAFAVDPHLCGNIINQFKEDGGGVINFFNFVNCEEINDALKRAMTTWSLNHPYIKFYNVTDECIAEGNGVRCSLAEVYIDAKGPASDDTVDVAAFVRHNPDDVGRSYSGGRWRTGVRAPSGEVVEEDWNIQFSTVTFHNHICWYLDTTFCARFRALNENLNATLLMQFLLFGLWSAAFVGVFLRVAQIVLYTLRFGAKVGIKRAVESQANQMLWTYVLLFMLISPPIIWYHLYTPCITCYDFEATAAHEIGHVLGFTHPDRNRDMHRVALKRFGASVCEASKHAIGKGAVALDATDPSIEESIMFHLTTSKSRCARGRASLSGPVANE